MESIIHINISKTFAVLAFLLTLYWLLRVRHKSRVMPQAITWFLLYFLLHTFITYTLVFPERLGSDYVSEISTWGGKALLKGSWMAGFNRMILFAALAYALATYLKTDRQLRATAFSMGAGLLVTMLLGRHNLHVAGPDMRMAGGFENPNYFGSVAVAVFFINLAAWVKAGNSVRIRILSGCFILTSLTGCFVSGSRGSLFGLVGGVLVMLFYMHGLSRRVRNTMGFILIIMLAILFIPAEIIETFQARLSIERLIEDQVAGRLDIWTAYLTRMPQYFLTGVGYGRSVEVVMSAVLIEYSTHNQFLLVLVEQGIVGLLLFVLGLWQVWKRLHYRSKHLESWGIDVIYLGFFIAWMLLFMAGTRTTSRSWWFSLGIIAAHMQRSKSEGQIHKLGKRED